MQVQQPSLLETNLHEDPAFVVVELIDFSDAVVDLPSDDGAEGDEVRVFNGGVYEVEGLSYSAEVPEEQEIPLTIDVAVGSLFEIGQIGVIG